MNNIFKTIEIETDALTVYDITSKIQEIIDEKKIKNGYCLVRVPTSTAAIGITSGWDKRGLVDAMIEIDRMFPSRLTYCGQESPFVISARSKSSFIKNYVSIVVSNGSLFLGHSQWIYMLEFASVGLRKIDISVIEKDFELEVIEFNSERLGSYNITDSVKKAVSFLNVNDGFCHVLTQAATAGLYVTCGDEFFLSDVQDTLELVVPTRANFYHRETPFDISGHIKTLITQSQITLPIKDRALLIADTQNVIYAEYDGPRPRNTHIAVFNN